MSADFQTIAALAIVALTALWLVRRSFGKRKHSGCSSGECSAVSREVKDLQSKLKLR
jgi:hypothetical protein